MENVLVKYKKRLLHSTIGGVFIVGLFIASTLVAHLTTLEKAVLGLSSKELTKPIGEVLGSTKGEKGAQGEVGETGAQGLRGAQGAPPEGSWEKYCLYPENENGYRTEGVLIRKSSGNCKSSWREIEIWEK